MRFYDGAVAVVVGVIATGLAGCGGSATTTTAAPAPAPPPAPAPAPSPTIPIPTVTTPTYDGNPPSVPTVTCDDTSLNQALTDNLTCTETVNKTDDVCCGLVAGWDANVAVLVNCEGEKKATDADLEQIMRARCLCAGGNQWETQLKELSTVNMTQCEHPFHPLPGGPTVDLIDKTCACNVIESAQTTLKDSAPDQCEFFVNGAIDSFGWGTLRTACEATDLSVETDAARQTASPRADAKFPWALVAAAGVVGLSVMVVFRMKARASAQLSDVTELGASC